jgi:hypothetical protein
MWPVRLGPVAKTCRKSVVVGRSLPRRQTFRDAFAGEGSPFCLSAFTILHSDGGPSVSDHFVRVAFVSHSKRLVPHPVLNSPSEGGSLNDARF